MNIRGTTILAVKHRGKVVVAGDGQVTLGKTVMKHGARKVRDCERALAQDTKSRCSGARRMTHSPSSARPDWLKESRRRKAMGESGSLLCAQPPHRCKRPQLGAFKSYRTARACCSR